MYEEYRNLETNVKKFRRTSFLELVSAITHKDPQLRSAVDYVTGTLINENFETIE